jgi:hypothetical protein
VNAFERVDLTIEVKRSRARQGGWGGGSLKFDRVAHVWPCLRGEGGRERGAGGGRAVRGEPLPARGYTDKFVSRGEGGGSVTSAEGNQSSRPRRAYVPAQGEPGSRGVGGYRYLESTDDVSRLAHQEATG